MGWAQSSRCFWPWCLSLQGQVISAGLHICGDRWGWREALVAADLRTSRGLYGSQTESDGKPKLTANQHLGYSLLKWGSMRGRSRDEEGSCQQLLMTFLQTQLQKLRYSFLLPKYRSYWPKGLSLFKLNSVLSGFRETIYAFPLSHLLSPPFFFFMEFADAKVSGPWFPLMQKGSFVTKSKCFIFLHCWIYCQSVDLHWRVLEKPRKAETQHLSSG